MKGLLVGFGSIGRRHLGNLYDLGVADWAIVHSGQGTLPLEPPCPAAIYARLDEAVAEEAPTLAVIANPTSLHVQAARACVDAGCHVLLEKPVSHSLEGLDELQDAVAGRDVTLLVGFQFRFHPALIRIRALLDSGAIGEPLHARVIWTEHLPSWHPWEDWRRGYAARPDLGGGVHHTICHPIDYIRMLFGDPVSLFASLTERGPLDLPVPEGADVLFLYPGSLRVQLHLDYWGQPPMHRMEIIGTEGTVVWDYMTGKLQVGLSDRPESEPEQLPSVRDRDDLFRREAKHFLEVSAGQAQPVCTLEDGIAVARICETITRSSDAEKVLRVETPLTANRGPS